MLLRLNERTLMENERSPWQVFLDGLSHVGEVLTDWAAIANLSVDTLFLQVARFLDLCSRYGWCFVPDAAFNVLFDAVHRVNTAKRPNRELYHLLHGYFLANGCAELEQLVTKMKATHPRRLKILRDCVAVMRLHGQRVNGSRFNACNLAVPTLVAVVEGMLMDFARDHGISLWNGKRFVYVRAELLSVSYAFDRPALNLIFDILFSDTDANNDMPASGLRFNRHKIMHGNWLAYGRVEYVLRLFLMIRFLDYIIEEYRQRQEQQTDVPVSEPSKYSKLLSENFAEPARALSLRRVQQRGLSLPPGVRAAFTDIQSDLSAKGAHEVGG